MTLRLRLLCTALLFLLPLYPATARQAPPTLPSNIRAELFVTERVPTGTYERVAVWRASEAPAARLGGHEVRDLGAAQGKAWELKENVDAGNRYVVYGPYLPIEAGNYVVFARVKLTATTAGDTVGRLDAAVGQGTEVRGERTLEEDVLPLNQYVQVPLGFTCEGGAIECRIFWSGFGNLRIDTLTLFRVRDANMTISTGRIPQPKASGQPTNLRIGKAATPPAEVFLRAPAPSPTMDVIDVRHERPDRQLLLYTLQGLVNRKRPRLFVLSNDVDSFWLQRLRNVGRIRQVNHIASVEDAVRKYRHDFNGLIVTDLRIPASKNVATTMAGVDNCIVASPRLAASLGVPVRHDLRGRWQDDYQAYGWAYRNLFPKTTHRAVACLWPDHYALRDYLVQNRIFTFWLPGMLDGARTTTRANDEIRLAERILAQLPPNIPVFGYPWAGKDIGMGEGPGVTLFAETGKYLVGSINCANLSVHSGYPLSPVRQKPAPPVPPLKRNKVYVSWVISDGDNLPVLTESNFPQLWTSPVRGKLPLGWTMSPATAALMPEVARYYYSTSKPTDAWLTGVSGVGYTYPDHYGARFVPGDRKRVFDGFLDETARYMARADLHMAWIMGVVDPTLIRRYAEKVPSLAAIFPDYGRIVPSDSGLTVATARGIPVFHAATQFSEGVPREKQIAEVVRQIRSIDVTERPAFLHLFALNWFIDLPMLQEVSQRLGPDYVVVRPDHLAALCRKEMARRQVAVSLPQTVVALEGVTTTFATTVSNLLPRSVSCHVAAPSKLRAPGKTAFSLAPGGEAIVRLQGDLEGEAVTIRAMGAFGTRHATAKVRHIARSEVIGNALPTAAIEMVRQSAATRMSHITGARIADTDASTGEAWAAHAGDTASRHMVFGPYADLPAGRYLVLFRLKRLDSTPGPVVEIDACKAGGGPQTGRLTIDADDLPVGQYRYAALEFRHPGGQYETRALWLGHAGIAIDDVTLLRIANR